MTFNLITMTLTNSTIKKTSVGTIPGFLNKTIEGIILSTEQQDETPKPKPKRGFAAMSPEKRKEVASKGGKISRGGGRIPKKANASKETKPAEEPKKSKRGFAAMDPDKRRNIASLGGKTSKGGGRPSLPSKARSHASQIQRKDADNKKLIIALGGKTGHSKK